MVVFDLMDKSVEPFFLGVTFPRVVRIFALHVPSRENKIFALVAPRVRDGTVDHATGIAFLEFEFSCDPLCFDLRYLCTLSHFISFK